MNITELQHLKTALYLRAEDCSTLDTEEGDRLRVETLRVITQINHVILVSNQVGYEMQVLDSLLTDYPI